MRSRSVKLSTAVQSACPAYSICQDPAFAKSVVQASLHREVMMHITAPQTAKLGEFSILYRNDFGRASPSKCHLITKKHAIPSYRIILHAACDLDQSG